MCVIIREVQGCMHVLWPVYIKASAGGFASSKIVCVRVSAGRVSPRG